MVHIRYADSFLKEARRLPKGIQDLLLTQTERFGANPRDPRLHTKILHGRLEGKFSFRVTRNYRVIYRIEDRDQYTFLIIDDRKDIYR